MGWLCTFMHHRWHHLKLGIWQCWRCKECSIGRDPEAADE